MSDAHWTHVRDLLDAVNNEAPAQKLLRESFQFRHVAHVGFSGGGDEVWASIAAITPEEVESYMAGEGIGTTPVIVNIPHRDFED